MSVRLLAGAAALSLALVGAAPPRALADPFEDALVPIEQYTSEKGRTLALKYARELRALFNGIYHCIPWVEVEKQSIGFQRPRHLQPSDVRYLSLRIFVEQDPSAAFARMSIQDRASAMYSRYAGPLLTRMARSLGPTTADASVDGFTIIVDWLKQWVGPAGDRPVHETIAVFFEKSLALDFVAGKLSARELAERAKIFGWDGDRPIGQLRVTHYVDDFVATYKVKNYQLDPGVTCP